MPTPSNPGVIAVEVLLRPAELIAAWRPETRRLVLPFREPLPRGRRVQARIGAVGLGVAATITGRVVSARRHPEGFGVELEPEVVRVQALERLVAIAAGAPVAYQPRAPRFLAALPAVVYGPRGPTYMTTFAVSDNGCGLAWSGPIPDVGAPMEIRLGAGREVASFCAEVRWTAPAGLAPTVGVHFAAGERSAWARMLDALKRSGAPPA
jgi:hypothetical protein